MFPNFYGMSITFHFVYFFSDYFCLLSIGTAPHIIDYLVVFCGLEGFFLLFFWFKVWLLICTFQYYSTGENMSYFCRSIYRYSFPNRLCTTYQLTFKEHLLFQVESLEKERVEHCNQLNSLKEKLTQAEETIKRLTVACVWLFFTINCANKPVSQFSLHFIYI